MFNSERHRIIDSSIGVKDVSDHAGVYLRLHLDVQPKNTVWRLNTSLLNDHRCEEYIKKEIAEYLEFNNNEDISPSVLWDAVEAVLRGKIIMWSSIKKKKELQKQLNDLSNEFRTLKQKHAELNESEVLEQIKVTKQKLNKILDKQVETKLKYIKQRYYETGHRAKKKCWHGNCANNKLRGQFLK